MPDRSLRSLALAAVFALAAPFASAGDYVQAPGSSLQFSGSYQGEGFSGRFPGFVTTLRFDPAQLASSRLDVAIPLASATTGVEEYDSELAGASFFDAKRFPQAHYTATKFRALGGNRYAADGMLTLRGTSKPVTLAFTWTPGARPVLAGRATVKRLAFDVGGGEYDDTALIPDDVVVTTKVVFTPK